MMNCLLLYGTVYSYSYSDCSPHQPIRRLGIHHLINGVHRYMCQLGANMHYNNASMSQSTWV